MVTTTNMYFFSARCYTFFEREAENMTDPNQCANLYDVKEVLGDCLSSQKQITAAYNTFAGSGVACKIGSHKAVGGSFKFIASLCEMSEDMKAKNDTLAEAGKTPLFLFSFRKKKKRR